MSFKDGNILSLTLINFQTFKNTTINFSSSLNFILGPNGSGKSTISNALSFIFGGNPKTIGKAKQLKEYIRFGEDKCIIEAKIHFNNTTIRLSRTLTQTSNSYYIDKESVKKNEYDAFIAKLRININNLCQYLPQERVSEFSRMSPEELLVQTCISLDKKDIVENLQATKEMEQKLGEVSNKENVLSTEKSNIKSVVDNIYRDVEKIKEKESKMLRVEMMESKKVWLEYENMKADYKRLTNSLKMLKRSLKENEKEHEKIKSEIESIRKSPLNLEMIEKIKGFEEWDNKLKTKIKDIKEKKTQKAYQEVDIEHLIKRREKNREDANNLDGEIEAIEESLEKIKSEIKHKLLIFNILKSRDVEQDGCKKKKLESKEDVVNRVMGLFNGEVEIDKYLVEFNTAAFNEKEEKLFAMKRKRNNIQDLCTQKKTQFDQLEEKKKKINEEGEKRLELLKRYHFDTYKAVVWYRENKSLFEEEIIEPAFLSINITNEKFTAEIETFLSFILMTSFICKDPRDFEKFMKTLKDEQRLSINAVEEIKKIERCEYSSSQIKSFGFDGTLLDFIEARKETKDFLIAHGHFDSIPVTKKRIDEKKIFQSTDIKRFAMENKYVEIKRSRYNSNDYVVSSSAITARNFFSKKIDTSEIESQLSEIAMERERHSEELKAVYLEIEALEASFKAICEKKKEHDKNIGDIKTRVNLFNMKLNTLRQKRESRRNLRDSKEIDLKESEIRLAIERINQQIVGLKNSIITILRDEEYLQRVRECMLTYKDIKSEFKKLDFLESNFQIVDKSIKELIKQIEEHERVKNRLKVSIDEYSSKLKEINNKFSSKEVNKASKEINKASKEINKASNSTLDTINGTLPLDFSEQMKLLPNTVEELNSEIHREKTQLKFINVNEEAKAEYEDKKIQLDRITADLSKMLKNKKKYEEEVRRKRSFLIKAIKDLVEKINKEFENLFAQINCRGQLEFYHKEEENVRNWKLNILVKFREKENLEVLSSFRQSGGEKSVSTILYLLALQKIDKAPFRLVDEINQGMDKHNEKSILNILFEMCKTEDSTQFFIISPKLVEGLAYNESMKVIILFSDQPGAVKKAFTQK
ncbi:Structural maintenance of chromosomes protein 5 [Nosema granulosis]|uniref:Structural maintenance of chromosomes protein 5 n=1 Tax=Nosema granulosis TaxID=83296 RepID=A0A9P6GYM5_9MICR|nr:Structural maintenance of chromosomes protein 5 [Nosema granulosis]